MNTPALTYENFESTVIGPGIVLVECWAPGCGPCEGFTPVYRGVAHQYPDHVFAFLNIKEQEELGRAFEVAYTPTVMVFRDGIQIFQEAGSFTEERLKDLLTQAQALDMDAVRAAAEAAGAESESDGDTTN